MFMKLSLTMGVAIVCSFSCLRFVEAALMKTGSTIHLIEQFASGLSLIAHVVSSAVFSKETIIDFFFEAKSDSVEEALGYRKCIAYVYCGILHVALLKTSVTSLLAATVQPPELQLQDQQ